MKVCSSKLNLGFSFLKALLFSCAFVYVNAENFRDRNTPVCEDMNEELHLASNGLYTTCIEVSDICDMDLGNGAAVNHFCPLTCDGCHSHQPITYERCDRSDPARVLDQGQCRQASEYFGFGFVIVSDGLPRIQNTPGCTEAVGKNKILFNPNLESQRFHDFQVTICRFPFEVNKRATPSPRTFAPSTQIIESFHPSVAPSTSPTSQQLSDVQPTSFLTSSERLNAVDRNVTFGGNYAIIIEGHEEEFFEECNEHSHPVYCTHVYPEFNPISITVTFRGDEEDLKALVQNIIRKGLVLDHFSTFTVTPEYAANVSLPSKKAIISDAEDSDASVDLFLVVASAIVLFLGALCFISHRAIKFQHNRESTENIEVQHEVNEGNAENTKPAKSDIVVDIEDMWSLIGGMEISPSTSPRNSLGANDDIKNKDASKSEEDEFKPSYRMTDTVAGEEDKKAVAGDADSEQAKAPATTSDLTDIQSGGENMDVADKGGASDDTKNKDDSNSEEDVQAEEVSSILIVFIQIVLLMYSIKLCFDIVAVEEDKEEVAGGADVEQEESPANIDIKSGGEDMNSADKEPSAPSPEVRQPRTAVRAMVPHNVPQPNMHSKNMYTLENCSEGPKRSMSTVNDEITF